MEQPGLRKLTRKNGQGNFFLGIFCIDKHGCMATASRVAASCSDSVILQLQQLHGAPHGERVVGSRNSESAIWPARCAAAGCHGGVSAARALDFAFLLLFICRTTASPVLISRVFMGSVTYCAGAETRRRLAWGHSTRSPAKQTWSE